ncbi:MAG TPA: NfeD family protein [Thermoplasmata archaeon]|jgi:membrane protein implicated in regulation of membrane protease activity|nr:NfeD family protein [Thermoplasmata archaeon]
MTGKAPDEPVSSVLDRLFLYGIRSVLVVLAVVVFGIFLIVHGWMVTRYDYIASGAVIVLIGIGLALAFQKTTTQIITKRYFVGETLVGKTGRALVGMKATGKGVVHVEHETWSAVAEEDISRGDPIVVTAVDADQVTLKVRKPPL